MALLLALMLAAGLDVSPVQISLTRETPKALLTLRNGNEGVARFQVSVFAWDEDPLAGMKLGKTEDIVFFPAVFSVKPGETHNVRVGAAVPFSAIEKTYRVFVEELPPAEKASEPKSTVRVLTRVGVPIFMEPDKALERLVLGPVRAQKSTVAAEVRNEGNVHERVNSFQAEGLDEAGKRVFEGQVQGWYVLAGGRKPYQVEVPRDACARVRKVVVTVKTQRERVLTGSAETPAGACG
jgi:fimbrial chaperone protein